jgi:hypothetical protein
MINTIGEVYPYFARGLGRVIASLLPNSKLSKGVEPASKELPVDCKEKSMVSPTTYLCNFDVIKYREACVWYKHMLNQSHIGYMLLLVWL